MSHRDSCPDRYDAEREGKRAFERGSSSFRNPYDDPFNGCEEASRAWDDGFRRARRH